MRVVPFGVDGMGTDAWTAAPVVAGVTTAAAFSTMLVFMMDSLLDWRARLGALDCLIPSPLAGEGEGEGLLLR